MLFRSGQNDEKERRLRFPSCDISSISVLETSVAPLHVRVHVEEDWAEHVFRLWMCGLGDLWRRLFYSRQLGDAAYRIGGGGGAHQHCE